MHGAELTFGEFVHGTHLAEQIKRAEGHKMISWLLQMAPECFCKFQTKDILIWNFRVLVGQQHSVNITYHLANYAEMQDGAYRQTDKSR